VLCALRIGRWLADSDKLWRPAGGGRSSGGRVVLGFRGEGKEMRPRERERRGRRAGAWMASPRGHAGPASGRRRGDTSAAGQRATPGHVPAGDRGLTSGPG
jgi:hypothetical protein